MTEKRYHIYLKDKCIYHSLTESEFSNIWKTINHLIDLLIEIDKEELQYEEVIIQKDVILNSSH